MITDRPLAELVGAMALQSAFEGPCFSPVTLRELADLEIEISVLTPMKPVSGPNDIVVGRDGVLLKKGGRSAVFLPQVAPEQGWGRDEMLSHLSQKAGLPSNAWRDGASFPDLPGDRLQRSGASMTADVQKTVKLFFDSLDAGVVMKYRIYIDDVGNPDLESSENPNHQFLSLTGVIIALG